MPQRHAPIALAAMLAIRLISAQVTADAWAETYTYDGFENMGSPLRPFRRDARAKEWTPAPGPVPTPPQLRPSNIAVVVDTANCAA